MIHVYGVPITTRNIHSRRMVLSVHRAAGFLVGLEILDQPYGEEQIVNLVGALILSEHPFVYQCGDGGFHGIW